MTFIFQGSFWSQLLEKSDFMVVRQLYFLLNAYKAEIYSQPSAEIGTGNEPKDAMDIY